MNAEIQNATVYRVNADGSGLLKMPDGSLVAFHNSELAVSASQASTVAARAAGNIISGVMPKIGDTVTYRAGAARPIEITTAL